MSSKQKKGRKTLGEVAVELQQKEQEVRDPIQIQRENEKGYVDNLLECTRQGTHKHAGDFYVVVITKNEKLLNNVFRCFFFDRATCPTPDYDQSVFFYKKQPETLEHVWTIPDRETCHVLVANRHTVAPEERQLLENVIRFKNGDLWRLCKKLNNEEEDSSLLLG
jgi:hypothetical protein